MCVYVYIYICIISVYVYTYTWYIIYVYRWEDMLFRIWKNTCLPWSWEIFSMMRMHWSVGYSILRPNLVKLHSLNKLDVHSILIPFWGHEFEHFCVLRTGSGRIHHALSDFKIKGCTCLFANRELWEGNHPQPSNMSNDRLLGPSQNCIGGVKLC